MYYVMYVYICLCQDAVKYKSFFGEINLIRNLIHQRDWSAHKIT